jgi:hemolysin III
MSVVPLLGFHEPFSSWSHLLYAIVLFVLTFFLMHRGRGNNARLVGLFIYSLFGIFLFSMSGVYHILERGGEAHYVLGILDHTAIYSMIAGTFTPLHIILFRGLNRWLILSVIWTFAIAGLTFTAIFFQEISEGLMLTFFLALGWVGLFSMWKIYQLRQTTLFVLLLAGGICYSVGAIFEFLRIPVLIPGYFHSHELFHVFVIIGATIHWILIYKIASLPISDKITFEVARLKTGELFAKAFSEHKIFQAKNHEDLRSQVMSWIRENYHEENKPSEVIFKFYDQETINLKS